MVMVGHYIGLYKYAENFPDNSKILDLFDVFLNSKINFILDENFWVILFFVVSGYLVSMSNILSLRIFVKKSLMRFLRLGLPVFCSIAIIFVVYKTIGFYSTETKVLFDNAFIQKAYAGEYNIVQVLLSPINVLLVGDVSLNSPFWVLREMFLTSVIIYFLLFLQCKIKNGNIFLCIVGIIFFISMVLSIIVFAGILGFVISLIENNNEKKITSEKVFVFFTIIFSASLYFISRTRIACIFFGCLILFIPKLPLICSVFASKIAQYINKISFGIYAFHWPVFCSFGMLCMIKLSASIGLLAAYIISSGISVLITILLAVCFYNFIEKRIYVLLRKLDLRIGGYIK